MNRRKILNMFEICLGKRSAYTKKCIYEIMLRKYVPSIIAVASMSARVWSSITSINKVRTQMEARNDILGQIHARKVQLVLMKGFSNYSISSKIYDKTCLLQGFSTFNLCQNIKQQNRAFISTQLFHIVV